MTMNILHCVKKVIRCIKLMIVLKLVMVTSISIHLSNLTKICCVDLGTSAITALPQDNLCTAIATYSENKDAKFDEINALRGSLPLVYIINDWNYDEMIWKFKNEGINELCKYLNKLITEKKINVMIFDNFQTPEKKNINYGFQNNIHTLIKEIKKLNPDVIFGLTLSPQRETMANAFDLKLLNNIVDVFLAKTYDYDKCVHLNHQIEMKNTSPIDKMRVTLSDLTSIGYDLSKMILIIRIIVQGTRSSDDREDTSESYTSFCTSFPGKKRKFCKESLSNFYQKGLLVSSNKMLGCILQSVDRDDYIDKCHCGIFPVVKCIVAGINGRPQPTNITSCNSFGVLPRDQVKT